MVSVAVSSWGLLVRVRFRVKNDVSCHSPHILFYFEILLICSLVIPLPHFTLHCNHSFICASPGTTRQTLTLQAAILSPLAMLPFCGLTSLLSYCSPALLKLLRLSSLYSPASCLYLENSIHLLVQPRFSSCSAVLLITSSLAPLHSIVSVACILNKPLKLSW